MRKLNLSKQLILNLVVVVLGFLLLGFNASAEQGVDALEEEIMAPAKLVAKNEIAKSENVKAKVKSSAPAMGIADRLEAERALAAQELESNLPIDSSGNSAKALTGSAALIGSPALAGSAQEKDQANQAPSSAREGGSSLASKSEKETPVLLSDSGKGKGDMFSWGRTLLTLSIFVVIFAGSAWAMKKYSKKVGKKDTKTKIQILTQHYLGPKKSLLIIQVAGETMLLGVTDHNISMIKSIALIDDEIPQEVPERFQVTMDDFVEEEEFRMEEIPEIRDRVTRSRRVPRNMN